GAGADGKSPHRCPGACTWAALGRREVVMATHRIRVTVNGMAREAGGEPRLLLVHFLREILRSTGTHLGCRTTHSGASTVHLDGKPIKSCTLFAVQADGRDVLTVEGLEQNGQLHPIQEGFWQEHGLQCGFCTPGMLITGYALLQHNPAPTDEEIRWAISGNLCRCTGYVNIVKAVQYAAEKVRQGSGPLNWAALPRQSQGEAS